MLEFFGIVRRVDLVDLPGDGSELICRRMIRTYLFGDVINSRFGWYGSIDQIAETTGYHGYHSR